VTPAPRLPLPRRQRKPRPSRAHKRAAAYAMSCAEIADALGMTPKGVELALARGLAKLRAALGAEWGMR
jgi:DNA-directed RNA polymerase specialized sigma24 family protein